MAISLPLNRIFQLYEQHGRWLPPAANAVLVVMLAALLAELVWALIPTPESAAWRPAPALQTLAPAATPSGPNVDAIVEAHLFGTYAPPADPALANLDAAPDTRLNLTLLGILAGSNERDSRALIASQPGDEQPYTIGEDVIRGVTLQAIFPDRVILSRGGALETLRLDKDRPSDYTPPAVQSTAGDGGSAVTAASLNQIREQILTDPSKASDFIRVQPANAGGQMRGYRIYPGRDRTLFSEVGLRPGDLVTSVNGVQLDDTQKALQMLNDLSRAGNITLTIERGGQVQTVNVSLN